MSTSYLVPLSGSPETFSIALAGVTYRLTVQWRDAAQAGWVLDIADSSGARILSGIPLVTGADLLAQHRWAGVGGSLYVQSAPDPDAVPGFDDLGSASQLYFISA